MIVRDLAEEGPAKERPHDEARHEDGVSAMDRVGEREETSREVQRREEDAHVVGAPPPDEPQDLREVRDLQRDHPQRSESEYGKNLRHVHQTRGVHYSEHAVIKIDIDPEVQ